MNARAYSVYLHALIMASRSGRVSWLIDTAIRLFLETDWSHSAAARYDANEAIREIRTRKDRPALRTHMNVLLRAMGPNFTEESLDSPLSEWQTIFDSKCAFVLANFLKGKSVEDALAATALAVDVQGADLPSVASFTPRSFLGVCKRRRLNGVLPEISGSVGFSFGLAF